MNKRLFIISNRLPITFEKKENHYICRQSSGGLVSAVNAYINRAEKETFTETIWMGIPGCSEKVWNAASDNIEKGTYTYAPIFMNWKKYELYYNGFSNSLLWPLFHYFPSFADYNQSYYEAYMEANEIFSETISKQLTQEDIVWIHDYHLLPLAGMLRKKFPTLTIGFFLHIPFPSYELFREIPKQWQREILTGMLGADLIGFHTIDYTSHFLSCVEMILKTTHDKQYIFWENRQIKTDAFPISIDYHLFHTAYDQPQVMEHREKYLELKQGKKILFSVDRLDYTKGITNRLKGYEQFLIENPDYIGKIVFALVIVPSRDAITRYVERKKMIDEYIGNLNSKWGNISWQPVLYQYNHLSFEELIALYTTCDIAIITPLRDGMNLVSKEFVASRKDKQGVLILSEMAGAARELSEALLINPNDSREIAAMIKTGLEMKQTEQETRMIYMQERICRYDVNAWAHDFFTQLTEIKKMQSSFEVKFLNNALRNHLINAYEEASKRLLLLDYDGSLVAFSKFPSMALPDKHILQILQQLAAHPENDVYIVSGRESTTLEQWLGHLPIGLIAEHGMKIRSANAKWNTEEMATDIKEWMPKVEKIMENYLLRCPHTFIEKKEFSIAWHYRNTNAIQGSMNAKALYEDLLDYTTPMPLQVLNGNKVIEVKTKTNSKGSAIEKILQTSHYDFILALGDDQTDEDMFRKLEKFSEAFTIKVGIQASFAKYNLHTPQMVQALLQTIASFSDCKAIAS